jgi:MoaA/NifB/PqqE/SkfB family radical SAM enzyme
MENIDYERKFTSTGEKFFRHTKALRRFQNEGKGTPIVMHVMPTSLCNLKCSFCSVKDRKNHQILSLDKIILPTIDELQSRGLKSIIISGGGEPTTYPNFKRMIDEFNDRGLEIGLITNGTRLNKYNPSIFEKMEWLRISINSLDYIDKIDVPKLEHPTIGFSYIVTDQDTTEEGLEKIRDYASKFDVKYVRLLPDCAQPLDQLLEKHKKIKELAKKLGEPFFHQYKIHKTPEKCYLGYFHPVLYCDGNIYPCDSLVLNDFNNQQFHEDFKICRYDEIGQLYDRPVSSLVDTKKMCPNCVFERQNTLLHKILDGEYPTLPEVNPIEHENFI